MTQTHDDYYSNISSSSDADAPVAKKPKAKKVVVRKKVAVKPKIKSQEPSSDAPKVTDAKTVSASIPEKTQEPKEVKTSKKAETLNERIERKTVSKLKVVSKAADTPSETPSSKDSESKEPNYKERGAEKKTAPKFKSGFSKQAKTTPSQANYTDEKGGKKAKFFSGGKSQKHKKNFEEDAGFTRSNKIKSKKKEEKKAEDIEQNLTVRTGEVVVVPEFLSLKEFSEKIGVPMSGLIAEFMKNGMMMTINSQVDFDTASLIAEAFEITLEKQASDAMAASDLATGNIKDLLVEDDASKLEDRPPVISIMGHVDHGKTSLLDHIRSAKVAAGEAGWITQSIWAYQVESKGKKITFLDTPGHEAFTIMRSRGAKSTDIAILVVAADEGVKPQTIESISHAKEAGIPVIVAINKMDKEWANPDHVKGQLAEHGLTPEDWGGETPMVPVSAHTGFGIDELLEIIVLVAEMQELKANPNRLGVATIIESHLDTKLGPVATVLVNTGKLEKTSAVVCGEAYGKVKVLKDYTGKAVKYALPGDPVLVVGLDKVVEWGDVLQVVAGVDVARQKSVEYAEYMNNQKKLNASQLDILMSKIKSGNLKHLKVVVKADTNGSLEAIKNALLKLSNDETSVSIIHSGVGNITEGDVLMCWGSSAILVGFSVSVDPNAKKTLEESGVEYIESKIIYHITERIEKIVTGMLDPKEVEVKLCNAKVGGIFYTSKKFLIVGLKISGEDTSIEKGALVRVLRGDRVVGKGKIDSLKQWVEEVQKLEGPIECGIKLTGYTGVEEKDVLEVYKIIIEK